jgi:hypothetical protein
MNQNKIFKVGTIISFKEMDRDQYNEIGMIIDIQQKGNGFTYYIYDFRAGKDFGVNGSKLIYTLDKKDWKIEYEPG